MQTWTIFSENLILAWEEKFWFPVAFYYHSSMCLVKQCFMLRGFTDEMPELQEKKSKLGDANTSSWRFLTAEGRVGTTKIEPSYMKSDEPLASSLCCPLSPAISYHPIFSSSFFFVIQTSPHQIHCRCNGLWSRNSWFLLNHPSDYCSTIL